MSQVINPGSENDREIVFYLATPPSTFKNISKIIKRSIAKDSTARMRIAFEKPFGFSLSSSRELNDSIAKIFSEDQIYRVDHYLGKALVQDILLFRFSNLLYEQIWSNQFIDHIQITIAESIGVEYRAGYYDKSGAIKDMLQNHLMQLLSLITMEEPKSFEAKDVREQMANVISNLADPKMEDLVVGQYNGYIQEKDVPADSGTETFVAVKTQFKSDRWQGVPIYLKTGKKLESTFAEINIVLKDVTCKLFMKDLCKHKSPNIIKIRIQPDTSISLSFNIKKPGAGLEVMPAKMDFCHSCLANINTPEAYENVFQSIIDGDQTIFTSWASIENSWKYTDKLLQLAKEKELAYYSPKSQGPQQADKLLQKDGREWIK